MLKRKKAGYSKILVDAVREVIPTPLKQVFIQNKLLRKYYFRLRRTIIKPLKTPRVYIRKGISRMEFFDILHQRKVDYVLLRWWHNLPEIPDGEDMDILIKDEHRDLINDLVVFYDNGTGLKCDIYTIAGSKHGCRRGIPYFQANIAHTLINSRVMYRGAYVPAPLPYFAGLAFHALFHKGCNSGLPGFSEKPVDIEHSYTSILDDEAKEQGIEIELTAQGVYKWLKEQNFAPAEDTLSKLVELKPELAMLQESLYSDVRGGEVVVYIVRERLLKDGLIQDFRNFLKDKFHFDVIDVRELSAEEKVTCTLNIRGGKWDKGPYKESGGTPAAFVVAYDYHPCPLTEAEARKQPRMTNRNNPNAKYKFREFVHASIAEGNYNGVHSADNELDAWYYISLLGKEYTSKIESEIELRRARYATRWSLKKVMAAGPIAKEELIVYNGELAVKKTYRVGKERFFQRELFAYKELSNELPFVPPLLASGEGYVIIPFKENILSELPEDKKKQVIASKSAEVRHVIHSMHARGLAYVGFSPDNIIVTPGQAFYCTGFSFLQQYTEYPSSIEQAYEVAGVPATYTGDLPENFDPAKSSFRDVWGSYIGAWENMAALSSSL
ncbi:hypothetical protein [Pontibacter sp. H249]|uniref:hypothetical protein n=1 Tax=Pontibacter sp. H249 TaxID=3133420 RepID=UPI0030C0B69E